MTIIGKKVKPIFMKTRERPTKAIIEDEINPICLGGEENFHRAERDVLARELEEHKEIKTPYALSTYMIEKGAKVKGKKKEIAKEFAEQKAMKRKRMRV